MHKLINQSTIDLVNEETVVEEMMRCNGYFTLVGDRKDIELQKLCTNYPHRMYFPSTPLPSLPSLLQYTPIKK